MKRKKILIAQFKHETNTFCSTKTGKQAFEFRNLKFGDEIFTFFRGVKVEVGGFIDVCESEGFDMVPVVAADASPSGIVTRDMVNLVTSVLLEAIKRHGPIDGILLSLHGAMVTEDAPDGEGELLEALRLVVGYELPIMATLDLHANVTPKMAKLATALFGYDSYPHIDQYDRGCEAAKAMAAVLRGEIKPVMALQQIPILCPLLETAKDPMRGLMTAVHRWEAHPDVICVSLFHGFEWADIYDAGMSVTAITNNDSQLAEKITQDIQNAVFAVRSELTPKMTSIDEAIKQAMEAPVGPIMLSDTADNIGGGGPGDSTHILRRMVEMGANNVGFAIIVDPETVDQAIKAGVRSTISVRLGGKVEPICGEPLQCTAVVKTITDGNYVNKGPMGKGLRLDLGRTVVLSIDGIDVVVTERRIQPWDPEVFRRMGIEPSEKQILVIKSSLHYRAAFDPIIKGNIVVDAPGIMSMNVTNFSYHNIRRPIFPLDI